MTDTSKRQYVFWLTRAAAKTLGLPIDRNGFGHQIIVGPTFYKLKDRVFSYSDKDIASIGYKDSDDIGKIKMLAVFNQSLGEQYRTREQAMAELLGKSVDQLLNLPVK